MDRFIIDNWTQEDYNSLILYLKSQADLKYRDFHSKLIPNCDKEYFIGIRVPVMRKLGKAICKGNPRSFLKVCGNKYYEESMLYGIVTCSIKTENFSDFSSLMESFVKRMNNWALCDSCKFSELKKYKEEYFSYIEKYLNSDNPWEIRYGIITMFEYKEDKKYLDDILVRLKNINYDHYYVKMAKAWLTAELFAFHKNEVFNFLRKNYYDKETFLMTCSKIRDSRRVSDKDKEEIKEFKKVSLDKL